MKAEIVYGYSKLGWDKIDNSLVFRYNNLIAKEPTKKKYIYNGNLCLNHKGSLDEWCNMIQNEVCGNIPMSYLLMASFASPLLSILNFSHDFGSILFCLCNNSSKGKSTTAMLCASVYSSPVLNKGVAITFTVGDDTHLHTTLLLYFCLCLNYYKDRKVLSRNRVKNLRLKEVGKRKKP